jgi:glycerol-3-phosphate acyltransferase PlsX
MRIALDAMGGDHAPGPIVAGAVQAVVANPDLHVILVGDQGQIEPLLARCVADAAGPAEELRRRLELFHASQVVGMDESPVVAHRRKPDNSIRRCWQLLAQGNAEGLVSAGNTGAMVAGGLFLQRYLKGVKRPGIAAPMPTLRGPCVLLDVGANISPKPEHLFQYGLMGAIYAQHILGRPNPTIGLMNVGSEEEKGHTLAKETHALFNASPLRDRFIGNVEGRDLHTGVADVVVCDGFVGNVMLKLSEGVFEFIMKTLYKDLLGALEVERDKAEAALQQLIRRFHYSTFGGAPLLGIDGICIICHGSSDDQAIKNALEVARRHSQVHLNELIVKELESAPATQTPDPGATPARKEGVAPQDKGVPG